MPKIPFQQILITLNFAYASLSYANDHEFHEQHSHIHGAAQLTIAQDTDQVVIELKTPALNILGFESAPQNAAQKEQLANARTALEAINNILVLSGGNCKQTAVNINVPFSENQAHEKEHHTAAEHEEHTDFAVTYTLLCDPQNHITAINVRLFDLFKGFSTVDVQWVLPSGQGATTLNAQRHFIEIK